MLLLGLHGAKQSGKDTAFRALSAWGEERGLLVVRRGFGDKLKLSAARLFYPDCNLEFALAWFEDYKEDPDATICAWATKKTGADLSKMVHEWQIAPHFTVRQLLQRFGTEAHRDVFGQDFWVDQLIPRDELRMMRTVCDTSIWDDTPGHRLPDIVCFSDTRFVNEADRIRQHKGQVWEILRPRPDAPVDTHVSEKPLPRECIDRTINNNNGPVADYDKLVIAAAKEDLLPRLPLQL